ncbi:MAG: hypothetical protein E7387_01285 [Ruminococcaceae bacterium]|nr:hypothetical protein [Oscillospiraceae bacterium]
MKDSGIEWIGEIPADWNIVRIGTQYTERKTKVSDTEYPPLSVTMKGIVPQLATAAKTDAHDDRKLVCKGDFAINSRSDRRGSCGISAYDGSVSLINTIMCPRDEMNPEYYDWLFHSTMFSDEFYKWGHGIVDDLWTTNWQDMKRISIPEPTLEEQARIAKYLTKVCAEIDSVIAKTKATIEEYTKLKQSIVVDAITKGIRGDRLMKDSGIEWIGEIPADWNIKVAFQMFKQVKKKNEGLVEQNLLSLSYGKIKRRNIDAVGGLLPESFDSYNIIEKDDIVLRLTDLQNDQTSLRVGLANERGIVTSAYLTLRNQSANTPLYLYYYLHSFDLCKGFYGMGAGVRQGLNWDGLKLLKFALPSVEEQMEITEYLEKKCSEIDALIEKKTALLAEMETYKKSVIYEYVTGKKDITTESEQTVTVVYPYFPAVLTTNKARFAQAILMSKILDSNVSFMGRVKLEKMLFTIEYSLGFDFDTEYHREAAGPLDSSIYECEKIISHANKWFYVNTSSYGVSYKPQKDMSKYKKYYERYFSDYNEEIERIIDVFKNYSLEKAEIIATLYGAWNDFIIDKKQFTDEDIVVEVLTNWNDSKKRFSKEVWLRAIESMKKNNIVPKGYGKHTIIKEVDQ